jgi:hypothetical protein
VARISPQPDQDDVLENLKREVHAEVSVYRLGPVALGHNSTV